MPAALNSTEQGRALIAITAGAYQSGASSEDIGRDLGLTRRGVIYRLARAGVPRRHSASIRKSIFEMVYMRAHGLTFRNIADRYGVIPCAIHHRLKRAGALDCADLLDLTPIQLEVYRRALDEDRLNHADAMEIASEYRREVAA